MKASRKPKNHLPPLFLLLVASNALIAYSGWPSLVRVPLFALGVMIPLVYLFKALPRTAPAPGPAFASPGPLPWTLVALMAVLLRVVHPLDLSIWPLYDETSSLAYSLDWMETGEWVNRSGLTRLPLGIHYLAYLFFHIVPPSLESFRAFQILLSLLSLSIAYPAARSLMPGSGAFFLFAGLGLSFWPLYTGRISTDNLFILLPVFLLLMGWFRTQDPSRVAGRALVLGLGCSLAFLFSPYILPLVAFVSLAVLLRPLMMGGRWRDVLPFAGGLVPAILVALLLPGDATRLLGAKFVVAQGGAYDTQAPLSYLTAWFWGSLESNFSYGPVWGGFLDPVLSSLLMLGVLVGLKRNDALPRLLTAGFVFLLIPGFLSRHVELFRVYAALPFALALGAIGAVELLGNFPARHGRLLLLTLTAVLLAFSGWHLFAKYADWSTSPAAWEPTAKSLPQWRAHRLLERFEAHDAKGVLFLHFEDEYRQAHHESLRWAQYKRTLHPGGGDPRGISWIAFLTHVNYQPFLAHRFPRGRWFWLDMDQQGLTLLGVVPIKDEDSAWLADWMRAERMLRGVYSSYRSSNTFLGNRPENIVLLDKEYAALEKDLPGDPFIRAALLEKRRWILMTGGKNAEAERLLEEGLKRTYPAAHFWSSLGYLRLARSDRKGARAAYLEALNRPPSACMAREQLIKEFGEDPTGGKPMVLPPGLESVTEMPKENQKLGVSSYKLSNTHR